MVDLHRELQDKYTQLDSCNNGSYRVILNNGLYQFVVRVGSSEYFDKNSAEQIRRDLASFLLEVVRKNQLRRNSP